ncbi:MAG: hypothetical protein JNM18_13250 [Planctomycetaceae bacterium]|nr:hypothetical protein [Planctomycetaceae bacterium]
MINRVQDFYDVQYRLPDDDPRRAAGVWSKATERVERVIVEQPGRSLLVAVILGMVTACLVKRR